MVRVSRGGESSSISFEMGDERYRLLREGYLDTKAPPDSPERILHKAWRRLWVTAIIFLPQGRGEPHLVLQLCRRAKDEEPLKHVKASRDGLRLFRCRSGTRALRCWALASGSTLLLYLAASTEEETQEWMHALREGLWPTLLPARIPQGSYHNVSLIDDEKSFTSGLLGVYGRLVKSEEMISVIHPHWQGTQMRWRLEDILEVKLIRKVSKDSDTKGVFSLTVRSSKSDTRTLQFYSNTAATAVDWIKSYLSGMNKDTNAKLVNKQAETLFHAEKKLDKTNSTPNSPNVHSYATVQKTTANSNSQDKIKDQDIATNANENKEAYKIPGTLLPQIPSVLLNASVNSLMMLERSDNSGNESKVTPLDSAEHSTDSDDSTEYNHIYEDLDLLKDNRTYTVYEEIDDDDDGEYVPPAPPSLPQRQIQNLNVLSYPQELIQNANGTQTQKQGYQMVGSTGIVDQQGHKLQLTHNATTSQNQDSKKTTYVPTSADLRLQRLCESVSEALKMTEEPLPSPTEPKRSVFFRKKVIKHKNKSPQASLAPDIPEKNKQSDKSLTKQRNASAPDLKKTILKHEELPIKPFKCPTEGEGQGYRQKESKPKQNHVPLQDLLKSLETESRRHHTHHRRGVSEGGKTMFQNSKPIRSSPTNEKKKDYSSPVTEPLDQEDEEYIDMS